MIFEDIFVNTSDWIDLADKDDSTTKRCEIRKAFFSDKHFGIVGFTNVP
jgi:hypothetical protein